MARDLRGTYTGLLSAENAEGGEIGQYRCPRDPPPPGSHPKKISPSAQKSW